MQVCELALISCVCLALLLGVNSASDGDAKPVGIFHVAVGGNDNWSGTKTAPNARRTDGPFATIQRAQQAARELRKTQPDLLAPVKVLIRKGTYFLDEPLTITPQDSGTQYAAYRGEQVTVSGGVRLTGWYEVKPGVWACKIPDVESEKWTFSQLWVNGQRRFRPMLPKQGYYHISSEVPSTEAAKSEGFDRFGFSPGEISADWHDLNDVEVMAYHTWTVSRLRLASVDESSRIATLTGPTCSTAYYTSLAKGNRFRLENVKEALSEPGEWYLDNKTGVLEYIPTVGEDIRKAAVVAPRLSSLLRIKGDPAAGRWVEHVSFQGLTFAHTNWVTPPGGYSFPQAEATVGGAISAEGARDCRFKDCTVTHVGGYAIDFGMGSKNNIVENCILTDLGAGGIKIGEMALRENQVMVAEGNTVQNCIISRGGRIHTAGEGVWIGHSPYNRIELNDIFDFFYTGISVGWSWGYGNSLAHHNRIAQNHIYSIGQGVLSDMGGIYTLGVSPGTVLIGNLIHDVEAFTYGGWGIYFDEGSTGILAEGNTVYRTKSSGFHQHYGRENIVRGNIFALGREAQLIRTRAEEHTSFTFENNIVYWKEGPLLAGNWSGDRFVVDNNIYWNTSGQPIRFGDLSMEDWQKKGHDTHSVVADPLFRNPDKGDFRLNPGSPALKLGQFLVSPARAGSSLQKSP